MNSRAENSQQDSNATNDTSAVIHLGNALPAALLFLVLAITVISIEVSLAHRPAQPLRIFVANNSGGSQEDESSDYNQGAQAIDSSAEILELADQIETLFVTEKVDASAILKLPPMLQLPSEAERISVLYHIIESLLARDDYPLALALFNLLTPEQRLGHGLFFDYARTLAKTGHAEKSMVQYGKLLQLQPNNQSASINLGLLLLQQRKYQTAKKHFAAAVSFTSAQRKAKSYAGLGDAELALSEYDKAIESYLKSIEYRPAHTLTWRKLARAKRLAGRTFSLVSQSYEQAVAIDPGNPRLLSEYAGFLTSRLEFSGAVKNLRRSLALDKANQGNRMALVVSYLQLDKTVNATKQAALLSQYASSSQFKAYAKGLTAFFKQEYDVSLGEFKQSLKKGRDNQLAYLFIGLNYLRLDKPKNAKRYLLKLNAQQDYFNLAQFKILTAELMLKRTESASRVVAGLLESLPESNQLPFELARIAYRYKNTPVSLVAINAALAKKNPGKRTRLMAARIFWRNQQKKKSLKILEELTGQYPRYKAALYRFADYLEQSGKRDAAIDYFTRLLDVSREYSDALYRLARLTSERGAGPKVTQLLAEQLQYRSDHLRARILYAGNFCETSQFTECHKQLELVLKLDPNNPQAQALKERSPQNARKENNARKERNAAD